MVEKDDLINQTFKDLVILYAILMISIFIINNFMLRQVWRPFYLLLERLKGYHLGRGDKIPKVTTKTTEFNDLQQVIETVLARSRATFEQQKEFIGNAAHELQTPLAIALNKLELLVERENLNEEDLSSIGETMDIIERLIRLNRSLLLLTKIENRQFLDTQEMKINEIIQKSASDLKEMAEYKGLEFVLVEKDELSLKIDPALADILVNNLLRNAVFHSENGRISIEIHSNFFSVENSGSEALDEEIIFHRFRKSKQKSEGTGLGLSIVKAICDLYQLKIQYSYTHKTHRFEVRKIK